MRPHCMGPGIQRSTAAKTETGSNWHTVFPGRKQGRQTDRNDSGGIINMLRPGLSARPAVWIPPEITMDLHLQAIHKHTTMDVKRDAAQSL